MDIGRPSSEKDENRGGNRAAVEAVVVFLWSRCGRPAPVLVLLLVVGFVVVRKLMLDF